MRQYNLVVTTKHQKFDRNGNLSIIRRRVYKNFKTITRDYTGFSNRIMMFGDTSIYTQNYLNVLKFSWKSCNILTFRCRLRRLYRCCIILYNDCCARRWFLDDMLNKNLYIVFRKFFTSKFEEKKPFKHAHHIRCWISFALFSSFSCAPASLHD